MLFKACTHTAICQLNPLVNPQEWIILLYFLIFCLILDCASRKKYATHTPLPLKRRILKCKGTVPTSKCEEKFAFKHLHGRKGPEKELQRLMQPSHPVEAKQGHVKAKCIPCAATVQCKHKKRMVFFGKCDIWIIWQKRNMFFLKQQRLKNWPVWAKQMEHIQGNLRT